MMKNSVRGPSAGVLGGLMKFSNFSIDPVESNGLSEFFSDPEYTGLSGIFPVIWLAESSQTKSVRTHLRRIQNGAYWLALNMGEQESFAKNIALASVFHDIGMGWIDRGREVSRWYYSDYLVRERMEPHTWIGGDFLDSLPQKIASLASDIAKNHHQRWDGAGFPGMLKGEEISIAARIVGVVHFFEENTQPDPMEVRMCHSDEDVIEMIKIAGGRYFDPVLSRLISRNSAEFVSAMKMSEFPSWECSNNPASKSKYKYMF